MAAGMGQACDSFTPYMRLLGAGWLKQMSLVGPVLDTAIQDCGGHPCKKITTEFNYGGRVTFWIDLSRGLPHKFIVQEREGPETVVTFENIEINHRLNREEFNIPKEVFANARAFQVPPD